MLVVTGPQTPLGPFSCNALAESASPPARNIPVFRKNSAQALCRDQPTQSIPFACQERALFAVTVGGRWLQENVDSQSRHSCCTCQVSLHESGLAGVAVPLLTLHCGAAKALVTSCSRAWNAIRTSAGFRHTAMPRHLLSGRL